MTDKTPVAPDHVFGTVGKPSNSQSKVPVPKQLVQNPKYKLPKGQIGPQYTRKIMPWFESFWHEKNRYPSVAEIMEQFGLTFQEVQVLHNSKFFLQSLDRRGIARPTQTDPTTGIPLGLNAEQMAAIAILTNYGDLRNPVARLAEAGITEEKLYGWRQNPIFQKELQTRASTILDNVAPDATVELAKAIKKGNFQAIKFYYEITGQASNPETLNVKKAMQILIEAVQKHVDDPETLQKIAGEVQSLRQIQGL